MRRRPLASTTFVFGPRSASIVLSAPTSRIFSALDRDGRDVMATARLGRDPGVVDDEVGHFARVRGARGKEEQGQRTRAGEAT